MAASRFGLIFKSLPVLSPKNVNFSVFRYTPNSKEKPRMQTYTVDTNECGPMILDALIKIKNEMVFKFLFTLNFYRIVHSHSAEAVEKAFAAAVQ